MKQIILLAVIGMMALGLSASPIQAEFFQCPVGGCNGSAEDDVIMGTFDADTILAEAGNDVVFGGAGNDQLSGNEDQDVLFGGLGDDFVRGSSGNDFLMPGPDTGPFVGQLSEGGTGNDTTNVFAGEISGCLLINLQEGADVVNLIGFGPFSASNDFGLAADANGVIEVVDPIAGGVIHIVFNNANDSGTEVINGLLSPNVTALPLNCLT
jgi:hypothetical protein